MTGPRWYFDESVLGAANILSIDRDDIVHPGHPRLPDLPTGVPDPKWMRAVAAAGWVAVTRDRRIRSRPGEQTILLQAGLRVVWFGGKKDQRPIEQAQLFLRFLPEIEDWVDKSGSGPSGVSLTVSGLRRVRLPRW